MPNTTNKIRTNLSILTTCLPVHLNHVNHHVDNNLPLRRTTIIEDTSQQDPSQWQDWDDWGKWKTPSSHDQSSWSSRKPDHAHYSPPTLYLGHHSPPFTPSCSPPLCGFPLQAPDRLLQFRSITSLVQKTASQVRQQTNPGDRPLATCRFLCMTATKLSG